MSSEKNRFTFTGCKAPFFGAVFKDVNYLSDPNKIHLREDSPEVKNCWGFFINQRWWTTHFFQWSRKWETMMVKLKWWYYFLFKEYIWKTKWVVTLKCKEIFERENEEEIINFLINDEKINTFNKETARNILWNFKKTISNKVNKLLLSPKGNKNSINYDLVHN